jgi:putative FmdB family regulatory protein
MPVYEYECKACGHTFEEWQKMSDAPVQTCPKCSEKKVERLISQTSFQLKGGGWYKDLYSSSNAKSSGSSDGASDSKSASKSESKADSSSKGESKSESKSESKADKPATKSSDSGGSTGSGGAGKASTK